MRSWLPPCRSAALTHVAIAEVAGARGRRSGSPRDPCRRSARHRLRRRARDGACRSPSARSRSISTRPADASCRATMSATIASPSSVRGLSSVTMTAIGQALGDRAHHRTLARIAIAAATEHADELSAAVLAHGEQRFFQCIGRVRVVDDRPAACRARSNVSMRPGGAHAMLERRDCIAERQCRSPSSTASAAEQVVDIEVADEPRTQRQPRPSCR